MAQDFVTVRMSDADFGDLDALMYALYQAEESADGRRIVVLGAVLPELLAGVSQKSEGKPARPYAVHAERSDGARRTWLVSSRDAARKLKTAYRADGGSATIQDTRKDV